MDPRNSAQDVVRCHLCDTPVPQLYCDICHINLCKICVGEHLLDVSKLHIVVPIKHRQSISSYPKCSEHTGKLCELHCEQCDIPVCVQCVSSKKHKSHDVVDILSFLESKYKALETDLEELGKIIYPKYQEIASTIPFQRAELNRNTEQLITALNKRGEEWHREIDNIIRKLKSDIEEAKYENLAVLRKQEFEINHSLSEITNSISELKNLVDSNDANVLSKYKPRNEKFRRLPPKLVITLPHFSPQRIDTDQLFQKFGSLTALSITTEERLYPMMYPDIDISHLGKSVDESINCKIKDKRCDEISKTDCKKDEEWFDENCKTDSKKQREWCDEKCKTNCKKDEEWFGKKGKTDCKKDEEWFNEKCKTDSKKERKWFDKKW